MLKSECRGGAFTPEGGTILRSNMSGGGNLLRGGYFLRDGRRDTVAGV